MNKILTVIQIISAVLILVGILIQQKGSGLSGVFGGSDVSYLTKRGAERTINIATIVFVVIFVGSILLNFIIAK